MQVQIVGGKLREGSVEARAKFRERVIGELGSATDPTTVRLPPTILAIRFCSKIGLCISMRSHDRSSRRLGSGALEDEKL